MDYFNDAFVSFLKLEALDDDRLLIFGWTAPLNLYITHAIPEIYACRSLL